MTATDASGGEPRTSPRCPACGTVVEPHDSFCEACGADLSPTEVAPVEAGQEIPVSVSTSARPGDAEGPAGDQPAADPGPRCAECGGEVGADGYCLTCGARARPPRDHFTAR
ncbi:double zinc ribbon domain-containing protein, partial [Desertihabitans aurantiacus]|uniref:double zinc ribbon domain-containing protein n=1 Tax=Desertihabitans aurantiacus TaxID=2282477 RepID=UPI0018E5002F